MMSLSAFKLDDFPPLPAHRFLTAPVYLEPMLGSGERLCVLAAVQGESGLEALPLVPPEVAKCLYGDQAESLMGFIEIARDDLLRHLESGAELTTWTPPYSGLMLGAGAEAYADDPLMAARLVARAHASLCHQGALKAIGVEQNETKRDNELNAWVKLTQDIAIQRNPALRGRFNQKVSLIGDETVTLPYAAPNKALNLGLLSPSRARRNIESIKLKLWNLQSLPASYRIRHLVLGVPRDDAPEMASVKTRQLMEKSLHGLREQVSENHLNVALSTVHSAQEAAEHILDLDRAA